MGNPEIPTILRIIPLTAICYYDRFVVVLLFSIFIPLRYKNQNYMPLATKLVANFHDFEVFISDEQCYAFFEQYLSYLKTHSCAKLNSEAYYGKHLIQKAY